MTLHPVPKPTPKPKSKPHPISRIGPRKLKKLGDKPLPFSTIVSKRKPVKRRDARKRESEFARCFHSRERVAFVKALRCFATGQFGTASDPIDNAHVCDDGSKGMGRRSGYACIAPLKRSAHRLLHANPAKFGVIYGYFDWKAAARWTEHQWQKHSGGVPS